MFQYIHVTINPYISLEFYSQQSSFNTSMLLLIENFCINGTNVKNCFNTSMLLLIRKSAL